MEIILIQSVRKLGKVGEIVNVKNGFGRNYLIPNGIAIRATESNKSRLDAERSVYEARNDDAKKVASKIAKEIEGKDLIFIRQSSDDKRLFGSVTSKEIAKELNKYSSEPVSHTSIIIEYPIKTLGMFSITAALHVDVNVKVNIIVVRTESEATAMLADLKKDNEEDDKEVV